MVGAASAVGLAAVMTLLDWRRNPSSLFHGPAGTDWAVVGETFFSWAWPLLGAFLGLVGAGLLARSALAARRRGRRTVREATEADADALARVFFESVRRGAAGEYDALQRAAWSGPAPDPARWRARLEHRLTFVCCECERVLGFAALDPDGRIDTLYVEPDLQGQGVATLLLARLESEAARLGLSRLTTEASLTAEPFFLRRGFAAVGREEALRDGVRLARCRMEKALAAAG